MPQGRKARRGRLGNQPVEKKLDDCGIRSYATAAAVLGIDRFDFREAVRGRRAPTREVRQKLAQVLRVDDERKLWTEAALRESSECYGQENDPAENDGAVSPGDHHV